MQTRHEKYVSHNIVQIMKTFLWDGAERLDPESSQISGSNLNKIRIYMIVMHMYAGLEIRIIIAGIFCTRSVVRFLDL